MRLVTFASTRGDRAGVIAPDQTVVPIADLVPRAPDDMQGVLEAGEPLWGRLRAACADANGGSLLASTTLRAPLPRPRRNVFCVGWNYAEHVAEGQRAREGITASREIPEYPAIFSKNPGTVTGPESPVRYPAPHSEQLDWEAELAVVIGTGGRDIAEDQALGHVFGYTAANDVSVRDVQRRHGGQWFRGKNFDTHLPLGPWIVTADELGDPQTLRITARVNGVTKQDSNTRFMVFKVPRIVRECSLGTELWPGDIIITGTPQGVGFARTPPEFMKPGDLVEIEIERIGILRNRVALRK